MDRKLNRCRHRPPFYFLNSLTATHPSLPPKGNKNKLHNKTNPFIFFCRHFSQPPFFFWVLGNNMTATRLQWPSSPAIGAGLETSSSSCSKLASFVNFPLKKKKGNLFLIKAMDLEGSRTVNVHTDQNGSLLSSIGNSTNIQWHQCSVKKEDRENLLKQKGCVIWITGLSGSGKSTMACALSGSLYRRGKLAYVLDGDNVRHGLNRDLSFKAEDRAENIRRIGEVAKLFADAGVICIASLISPYRRDRDACRALLPAGEFIEVFMDIPLHVCEARDPKGLYKLAHEGKIKGFTGIDDPYESPLNCEIALRQKGGECVSPCEMAEEVISYLEEKGFLQA